MIEVIEQRLNWDLVDSIPQLAEKELHLLCINLEEYIPFYQDLCLFLSLDEKEILSKYVFEKDKIVYGISQSILRLLLGFYLDKTPQEILIHKRAKGKPFIAKIMDQNIYFNKSHSGGLVIYGITFINEIGVDIEKEREMEDLFAMAEMVLSDKEFDFILQSPAHLRVKTFLKFWSCKEASTKAMGSGLSENFKGIDVLNLSNADHNLSFACNEEDNKNYTLKTIDTIEGYSVAFCLLGNYEKATCFHLKPGIINRLT